MHLHIHNKQINHICQSEKDIIPMKIKNNFYHVPIMILFGGFAFGLIYVFGGAAFNSVNNRSTEKNTMEENLRNHLFQEAHTNAEIRYDNIKNLLSEYKTNPIRSSKDHKHRLISFNGKIKGLGITQKGEKIIKLNTHSYNIPVTCFINKHYHIVYNQMNKGSDLYVVGHVCERTVNDRVVELYIIGCYISRTRPKS